MRRTVAIVGAKHHPGAVNILRNLHDNASLTLARDPDNAHDKNAIAVSWDWIMLGFVPARDAADIAPVMDARGITQMPGRFNKLDGVDCSVTIEIHDPAARHLTEQEQHVLHAALRRSAPPTPDVQTIDMAAAAKASPTPDALTCPICGGAGKLAAHQCWGCRGTGRI